MFIPSRGLLLVAEHPCLTAHSRISLTGQHTSWTYDEIGRLPSHASSCSFIAFHIDLPLLLCLRPYTLK